MSLPLSFSGWAPVALGAEGIETEVEFGQIAVLLADFDGGNQEANRARLLWIQHSF
jgi:hypothetical protein